MEPWMYWLIGGGVVVLLLLFVIFTYNGLISRKVETDNSWSQIDVQLQRRHDLIPNLVETVKGYAKHEQGTLEKVIQARNQAISAPSVPDKIQAENQLTTAMRGLLAIAEAYPDLKANQNFLALQEELTSTENRIGFARQHYNDVVAQFNQALMRFPANIVAGMLGFKAATFFAPPAADAAAVRESAQGTVLMADTFRDLIAENKRKSFWLMVLFVLLTFVVAGVLALAILLRMNPDLVDQISWTAGLGVGAAAALVAFLLMYLAYMRGDSMILRVSGAQPLAKSADPQLYNVVEEIAIAAGVPMPKVYLIPDSAPNAFATGRDPQHASVAITTGLREKLNREELQGVIAHEISHIRNYDIRLMMLIAVLIGTIVMLADFFWQIMWISGSGRRSSSQRSRDNGKGLIVVIVIVLAILLAMIAPLLAQIIQFAVSRQREYLADASAIELTRNPVGLADALRKIDEDPDVLETANRGTAHLYIANPIKKFEARAHSMFASHPPIKDRIRRLLSLVGEQ